MAVLFAIDNSLDIHDVGILALAHFFDADRNAVRNFSVKVSQKLFADYLRRNNALGLIRQSVLGEEKYAFLGKLFHFRKKLVHVYSSERRNGNDRFKIVGL